MGGVTNRAAAAEAKKGKNSASSPAALAKKAEDTRKGTGVPWSNNSAYSHPPSGTLQLHAQRGKGAPLQKFSARTDLLVEKGGIGRNTLLWIDLGGK